MAFGGALLFGALGLGCATAKRQSVVLSAREVHDFGAGPLTVTSATRSGEGQLVCYASNEKACPAADRPPDERGYVVLALESDSDRFKSEAVVPRGYRLCCGFAGSGGEVTLALSPHTPVGVEPGPSSGAPAERLP